MSVSLREAPHLRIDDLGYIIIGELSKPRQENLKSVSRHVDQKPPVVRQALEVLIEKQFVRKRGNHFELISNIFKAKNKPDEMSIDIIQYLCEPALLSASQLTKRAEVRSVLKHVKDLEPLPDEKPGENGNGNIAIQLVLKRLKTLEAYGIIKPIGVEDKRIKYKYRLAESPSCVNTKVGPISVMPFTYTDAKDMPRTKVLILGCPYIGECACDGKECRLSDEVDRDLKPKKKTRKK